MAIGVLVFGNDTHLSGDDTPLVFCNENQGHA